MVVLACPVHRLPLDGQLRCPNGHEFRRVSGIPILLTDDEPTHGWCDKGRLLEQADYGAQRLQPGEAPLGWVQRHAVATCGRLWSRPPATYPVPTLPDAIAHPAAGQRFLDIGCGWGRWSLAASRAGYAEIVGIDPYVPALEVAAMVADELGAKNITVVAGDGRHLPFADGSFDVVFSYSVLQHWSKPHARAALAEIGRVLRPGGRALVQITNAYGMFGILKRFGERRGWRAKPDIRYWTPAELREAFSGTIGPAKLTADGFFTLNPRADDLRLLPWKSRAIVVVSEGLRRIPGSASVADSLFVLATKA